MFAMSVKSVPGCLVLIVPRLIGVPVAFTPGFAPQDDVLVEALLAPLEVVELDAPLAPALLLLLELLPHPTSSAAPTNIASTIVTLPRIGGRPSRRFGRSPITMP